MDVDVIFCLFGLITSVVLISASFHAAFLLVGSLMKVAATVTHCKKEFLTLPGIYCKAATATCLNLSHSVRQDHHFRATTKINHNLSHWFSFACNGPKPPETPTVCSHLMATRGETSCVQVNI